MTLLRLYECLKAKYGSRSDPDIWWPVYFRRSEPPVFERVISNVLVTRTNWERVYPALEALDQKGLLTAKGLADAEESVIAACAKPVGFQPGKAKCLKAIGTFVIQQFGTEAAFCVGVTRPQLTPIWGVGPETADRILLYTCGQLAWPVDTYCLRVLAHYKVIPAMPWTSGERQQAALVIKEMVQAEMSACLDDWQRLHALMQREGESL